MRAFLCLFSGLWLTHPSASYVAPKPKISSGMGTNRETNTDFCTEKLARDLQTRLSSLLLVGSIVASPSCLPPAPLASETGVNAESRSHNSYAVSLERTSVVTRRLPSWGGGAEGSVRSVRPRSRIGRVRGGGFQSVAESQTQTQFGERSTIRSGYYRYTSKPTHQVGPHKLVSNRSVVRVEHTNDTHLVLH